LLFLKTAQKQKANIMHLTT